MSKVTIEYSLEEREDKKALDRALKSLDLVLVLIDIATLLRKIEKYDTKEILTQEVFNQMLTEKGIDIWELVD